MENIVITLDELQEMDRQYFLDHPTIQSFDRQYCAGEFGENYTNIEAVRVVQIMEGLRVRMPILTAKRNRRRTPKGRGKVRDFRSRR